MNIKTGEIADNSANVHDAEIFGSIIIKKMQCLDINIKEKTWLSTWVRKLLSVKANK